MNIRTSKSLFLFVFLCSLMCHAQDKKYLTGKITDGKGALLPNVTIQLNHVMSDDSSQTVFSNSHGEYMVTFPDRDSLCLTYTYIGYASQEVTLYHPYSGMQKDIVMKEDTTFLNEVVVHGRRCIIKDNCTVYLPSVNQKKSANSGTRLLYNMMIPELNVDRKTGNALTKEKRTVTQCINGVAASAAEIRSIRPKDVVRIDYYPRPTGKFSQYDAVIDFIVKIEDYGGYVEMKGETSTSPSGDYSAIVKYNNGHWTDQLLMGYGFLVDNKGGSQKKEWIGFDVIPLEKFSENINNMTKTRDAYGMAVFRYSKDKVNLTIRPQVKYATTPKSEYIDSICFIPGSEYDNVLSHSLSNTKSISTGVYSRLQWNISKRSLFSMSVNIDYSHNKYNRSYIESTVSSIPLNTFTEENALDYWAQLSYIISIPNGKLSFSFLPDVEDYRDNYHGSIENRQRLIKKSFTETIDGEYSISSRLSLSARFRLMTHKSEVNDQSDRVCLLLPDANLRFKACDNGFLSLGVQSGYINPPIAWKSSLSQKVNYYEIIRGNEDIGHYAVYMPSLSYTHIFSNAEINASFYTSIYKNSIQDTYSVEERTLIHSYEAGSGNFQCYLSLTPTMYFLSRKLQVSCNMIYARFKSNDYQQNRFNRFFAGLNILYTINDLALSAYYQTTGLNVDITSSTYAKTAETYGLSASLSKGRWYISVDADNFLGTKRYDEAILMSKCYTSNNHKINRNYYPTATLNISYSFDFGGKKQNREEMQIDRNINSGILKAE